MKERGIGNEIKKLSNLIHRTIENGPNKKKVDSVTGTNGWIIGYIACHEGQDIFQRDLEDEFGITRSTASKVVHLMIQKGLIKHESVPYDARLKKLVLTEKAERVHQLMIEDFSNIEVCLQEGFTQEELSRFSEYIRRMQENMQKNNQK